MPEAPEPKVTDETRPIASLKPDPRNPRRHPASQVAQIARSIEEFGFVQRVVIRPDGVIIGGHGTVEALRRLERADVEVRVVAGLTETQYKRLALALNKLPEGSDWNTDVLRELVAEIDEADGDLRGIGFSEKELDKLLGEDDAVEVREVETSKVEDEFWISIRGPLVNQAAALKALETVMKKFDGVTVDLGTIAVND